MLMSASHLKTTAAQTHSVSTPMVLIDVAVGLDTRAMASNAFVSLF